MPSQSDGNANAVTKNREQNELDSAKLKSVHAEVGTVEAIQSASNGHKTPPSEEARSADIHRGLKRKLSDSSTTQSSKVSRAVSPPWRKFGAEGPTSFVTEGRRRSGRTNALPLELQPQSGRRQTRAAYHLSNDGKRQSSTPTSSSKQQQRHLSDSSSSATHSKSSASKHPSPRKSLLRHAVSSKDVKPTSSQHKPSPNSSRGTRTSLARVAKSETSSSSLSSPTESLEELQTSISFQQSPSRPVRSLRLNFRRPPLPILNPGNVSRRKYSNFQEFVEQDSLIDEGEGTIGHDQARKEAELIQKLEYAATGNGALTAPWWAAEEPEPEPLLQPTHNEYLFMHVDMFVKALKNERTRHLKEAKTLAQAAARAVNEPLQGKQPPRPKTAQELAKEDFQRKKAMLRPLLHELKHRWLAFTNIVKKRKLAQLEQEQEERGRQALGEMLERSTKALEDRRRRSSGKINDHLNTEIASSQVSDEEDATGSGTEQAGYYSSSMDDYDDGDASSNSSEEKSDDADGLADDQLSREELLKKYGNLPSFSSEPQSSRATSVSVAKPSVALEALLDDRPKDAFSVADANYPELEEVDPDLLDSEQSDGNADANSNHPERESSMDDESDDESTTGYDSEASSEEMEEDEEDDEPTSLYDLLSAKSRKSLTEQMAAASSASLATVDDEEQLPDASVSNSNPIKISSDPTSASDPRSSIATPPTTVEPSSPKQEPQSAHENSDDQPADSQDAIPSDIKTGIPSLLRGQLREYQHYGLDWLAGMYATETNGILADEMGLGKTIQTIALLAHLATEKEVWGPHLIVVPTSVMLNWEMEFKKWCPGFKILTYYGNIEERRAKRRGWGENSCHVCITSYELAVQDASSLKRRNWHYLILDEAHNIKNFRSQRWQTLLSFKSEARLLLTGTPLQNNLSELWSLLFFLAPETDEEGRAQFSDLKTFTTSFKHPVEQILDHGRDALDDEAKAIVEKLHKVLRPHLLRRLKSEVEKQMPKKYEHVVKCRLSKRQRQLYDGFMNLTGTRESFASGNYMSIIACLMQLRKVCNHPDLFEERPILTSYAMPKSAIADYEIKELLVRKRLQEMEEQAHQGYPLDILNLWRPNISSSEDQRGPYLSAEQLLTRAYRRQKLKVSRSLEHPSHLDFSSAISCVGSAYNYGRLDALHNLRDHGATSVQRHPAYSSSLLKKLSVDHLSRFRRDGESNIKAVSDGYLDTSNMFQDLLFSPPAFSPSTNTTIQKFGCITPAVVAHGIAKSVLTPQGCDLVKGTQHQQSLNPFHESQTRLSIAFPDKNLIQYDCGKLQQLDRLLRELTDGGHRALIFTQMTKVLNILEQFLNLHGYRYLRLDGATKVEQRQALTDQFNRDPRIPVFILSSRSGGLGINLTGADTVIFYDLDWNPAMDKQCQDRCHRIGQTRDVHIYRFISEGTIEANILRKSNQKRMLDDVMIQEGEFTTDVFNRELADELDADADAALDMVIGGGDGSSHSNKQNERALANAEDKEDHDAAVLAHKEYVHTDDADFKEVKEGKEGKEKPPSTGTGTNTPDQRMYDSPKPTDTADESQAADEEEPGSYEDYMMRFMEWDLRDLVFKSFDRKKAKKGKEQGVRIRR